MTPKKSFVLLMIVIVLVGVLFWTEQSEYTAKPADPTGFENFRKIKPDAVQEIKLTCGKTEALLTRTADGWVLPQAWGYPASVKKVDEFLKALGSISNPEKRALSKENHAGFEVDAEKGRVVELKGIGDGLPARITFGKSQGNDNFFALLPDSETVYSVRMKAGFSWNLYEAKMESKDWFDLVYHKPPEKGKVAAITITTADGTIDLKKKLVPKPAADGQPEDANADEHGETKPATPEPADEIWEVITPEVFVADENAVRTLTGRAEREQVASDAFDPALAAQYHLEPPDKTVTYLFDSGERVTLRFGKEVPPAKDSAEAKPGDDAVKDDAVKDDAVKDDDGAKLEGDEHKERYFVQREGDRRIFEVQSWAYQGFFKTLAELKPKPKEPEPEPEPALKPEETSGPPMESFSPTTGEPVDDDGEKNQDH